MSAIHEINFHICKLHNNKKFDSHCEFHFGLESHSLENGKGKGKGVEEKKKKEYSVEEFNEFSISFNNS